MRRLAALFLVFTVIVAGLSAATKQRSAKDVRSARKQTEQEIARTNQQIKANDAETRRQLHRLESLQAAIAQRNDTIAVLKGRTDSIELASAALADSIAVLQAQSQTLQKHYGKALRTMRTRRQSMNNTTFVFSAKTFAQAWRRIRYLKQSADALTRRAAKVKKSADALVEARAHLDSLNMQNRRVMTSLTNARAALDKEEKSAGKIVEDLKGQRASLDRELSRRRQQAAALDRELQQIIDREAREARERAEREAREKAAKEKAAKEKAAREKAEREAREKAEREAREKAEREKATSKAATTKPSTTKPATAQPTTPAPPAATTPPPSAPAAPAASTSNSNFTSQAELDRRLTGSFKANKGRLLFPVAGRYSVTSQFGTNSHPSLAKVQYDNAGIDIIVPAGTSARAVYEGVVSSIFRLEGYRNVVIVRHGEYLTVYAGIDRLSVAKGQKVSTGQTLGTIYTDPDDDRTALHFEIRLEKTKLNPAEWVK